jgi:hypothetical protein
VRDDSVATAAAYRICRSNLARFLHGVADIAEAIS